jgi:hypothetical protein
LEDATEEEKKIGNKMIIIALWCIQMKPNEHPSMDKVVQMLQGEVECLQMPSKPFLSSLDKIVTGGEENSNQSNESSQSSQFFKMQINLYMSLLIYYIHVQGEN